MRPYYHTYKSKNSVKTGIFTLIINKDGEQIIDEVKYGTEYELPFAEERPGYEFVWKDEEGNVISGTTYTMPEKNTTVTGEYEANEYTLTYNVIEYNYVNGDVASSLTSGSLIILYGDNILNSLVGLTPVIEGHTLSGWKFAEDGTSVLTGSTMPNKDITVVNTYDLNEYTVTYMSDGSVFEQETYYFGQNTTAVSEIPEKEGYTFSGWDSEIPPLMPSHNITITAQFTVNTHNVIYYVDGVEKYSDQYEYGQTIVLRSNETKVGYTFSGWSEVPETMPDEDVIVNGTFTINEHTITYFVDGEEYSSTTLEYGAEIIPIAKPEEYGYTFSGWSEIPETMPDNDVTVTGTFTANVHTINYVVDGEPYSSQTASYGETIQTIEEPTKTGYTFSGWQDVPETMPDNDITIEGEFSINSYEITYLVDEEPYSSQTLNYGETIVTIDEPEQVGYTFSGWQDVPETMPANDITIEGVFTINEHILSYVVDGEPYSSMTLEYGAEIVPIAEPEKEGYSFSGWSEIPETMPDNDVTVTGIFSVNQYTLTFIVDSEPYTSITGDYGTSVPSVVEPEKEGYTFSGWDKEIPQYFPASNVTFNGTFSINSYIADYVIDGVPYSSVSYNYGATIIYPDVPKSGYTLSWDEVYQRMPASSITINGTYTEIQEPKTIYYNTIYTSGETSINNVSGFSSYEYEDNVEAQIDCIIPGNPDYSYAEENLDEDEFEQWCEDHNYSLYFATPTGLTFVFSDVNGNNLTTLANIVGTPFNVDGVDYQGYAYRTGTCCISTDMVTAYKLTIVKN